MRAYLVLLFVLAAFLVEPIVGDCYGQNPRFSNDRLMEESDNRNNANRLFDSQNNAKGGYCWGPPLTFYAGSKLSIEWTVQHSCGQDNAQCQMVIQYMCGNRDANASTLIRDGTDTSQNPTTINGANYMTLDTDGNPSYGMHEPYSYFQACQTRSRNKGLFIADQTPGNSATSTRQNDNGNNNFGFECAEERDYYPYWAPSPWKDIAVLTTDTSNCKYYQSQSQNVQDKYFCTGATNTQGNVQPISQQECLSNGGKWNTQSNWGIAAPDCKSAPWSRDNHLGNGVDGTTNRYNWSVPTGESCLNSKYGCVCVIRLRYNISTSEINGFGSSATDSTKNGPAQQPVSNDPTVTVEGLNLTLAINTAQFGRTFQDRSHTFYVQHRPFNIPANARIHNLNVRGKRGNIVQTYPATEYDFVPQHLNVAVGDYVHFQWSGCDHNPANNNGEGQDKTDRSNIVQIQSAGHNLPAAPGTVSHLFEDDNHRSYMAYAGQDMSTCLSDAGLAAAGGDATQNTQNCKLLNAASAYFDGRPTRMNKTGTFWFMSTRNNNFSNRSQKGSITVSPTGLAGWQIGLIAAGCVVGAAGAAAAGTVVYAKKKPHSRVAEAVNKVPLLNKI